MSLVELDKSRQAAVCVQAVHEKVFPQYLRLANDLLVASEAGAELPGVDARARVSYIARLSRVLGSGQE